MSDVTIAYSISEAIRRLRYRDPKLKSIYLHGKRCTDEALANLVYCLIANPNVVTHIYLGDNQLTDRTGVNLAHFLKLSSTIEWLILSNNQFGSATYMHIGEALCSNRSLQILQLSGNLSVIIGHIDMMFVDALQVNPDRPVDSKWILYGVRNELPRLKRTAEQENL